VTEGHALALDRLNSLLAHTGKRVVSKEDVVKLEEFEQAEAARLGLEEVKLTTNEEMLAVIG